MGQQAMAMVEESHDEEIGGEVKSNVKAEAKGSSCCCTYRNKISKPCPGCNNKDFYDESLGSKAIKRTPKTTTWVEYKDTINCELKTLCFTTGQKKISFPQN